MGSGGVASLPDVALMSSSHTLAGRIAGGATAREVAWGGPGWRSVGTYDPTCFLATVAVWEPRALRTYVYPWLLVVSWAVVVSLAVQLGLEKGEHASLAAATEPYFTAYSLLLTVIGFLLVFRLNRAALRFWDSRTGWGKLVEAGRLVTELLCVHCTHDKKLRDDAVCW
jgi:putative membrane protein